MKNDDQNPSKSREVIEPEIVEPAPERNFSSGTYYSRNNMGINSWYFSTATSSGCLPALITFSLFIFCFGQYGILAGIGFLVYHIIIAIIGTLRAAKKLSQGQPFNIWIWRCANWAISLFLVIWQSGGFNK